MNEIKQETERTVLVLVEVDIFGTDDHESKIAESIERIINVKLPGIARVKKLEGLKVGKESSDYKVCSNGSHEEE